MSFYTDANDRKVKYEDIAVAIRNLHPNLIGAHIFIQLDILNLRDGFNNGESPCGLPYSFSDYDLKEAA
ncbi:hypothetical protein [Ferribacterium limneticum]|uniref:hypothetical protein n=1 Tax=Ferribacterium limneticum TaxID=76259 RepID=UPI001CF91D54|nr:hypothetical protein [Ferribacterium limneticum]UCV26742.1 hypothetical protein KI617_10515 [Ferribacterium limneticum]UCV30659.1 hypothetical protein KI608_10515 [Ferribacterium limneticum]